MSGRRGRAFARALAQATLLLGLVLASGCVFPLHGGGDVLADRQCVHYDHFFATGEGCSAWSPDGSRVIAYTNASTLGTIDRGLCVVEMADGGWKKVLGVQPGFYGPEYCYWHPDQNRVFVDYGIAGGGILDLDSGVLIMVTEPDGSPVISGKWSPEGDSIWYWRRDGIHVIATTGGQPRPVAIPGFLPDGDWSFSPDGRQIAFANYDPLPDFPGWFRREIAVVNRDGTGFRILTHLGAYSLRPKWIHGGREILFDTIPLECAERFPNMERYWCAVDVRSGRVRRLGPHLGSARFQFSFEGCVVDWQGNRAIVVGEQSRPEGWPVGVLYTTPIERDERRRLFRPVDSTPHRAPKSPGAESHTPR